MSIKKIFLTPLFCLPLSFSVLAQDKVSNTHWPTAYQWKKLSDSTRGNTRSVEYIPAKENKDNWTLKTVMLTIPGSEPGRADMDQNIKTITANIKKEAPNAMVKVIEENNKAANPYVLYTVETPYFDKENKAMSQLFYMVEGDKGTYLSFVSTKEASLTPEFVTTWSKFLKESDLMYK